MTKTRPGFQRSSDLRFFFSRESVLVAIGTIALGVVEFSLVPAELPLAAWIAEWRTLVVTGSLGLILVPPALATGFVHLRARDSGAKRNIEMSTALVAINSRTSHLIPKLREVDRGEISGAYKNHSIRECQAYFAARRTVGGQVVDHSGVHIEVIFYQLKVQPWGNKLQRKHTSSDEPFSLSGEITARGKGNSKNVVEAMSSGTSWWAPDLTVLAQAAALGVPKKQGDRYVVALGVPVWRENSGAEGVAGMLLVTSSDRGTLLESDESFLRAIAWFLTVDNELNSRKVDFINPAIAAPKSYDEVSNGIGSNL